MTMATDHNAWTLVLERSCPERVLDTRAIDPTAVAGMVREVFDRRQAALTGRGVTERPSPQVWSALEYGCHVRDVFRRYDERLRLMLNETDPLFPNWEQDVTAVEDDYAGQDPVVVALELAEAGRLIAESFDGVK